jgi:Uma2 family endonuclease
MSIRYPDVSVYCGREGPEFDDDKAANDPRAIFEVLSAGTARTDLRVKLEEYRELPSVDTIVFLDIATERVRIVQRTGPTGWSDVQHQEPHDIALPALAVTLPHAEIFARD